MFLITISTIPAVVGTFLDDKYMGIAIGASLFAALLATAAPLLDFSRRAGVAASIANSLMDVTDDVRGLVPKSRLIGEMEIQREIDTLTQRLTRATAPAALQSDFYDKTQ